MQKAKTDAKAAPLVPPVKGRALAVEAVGAKLYRLVLLDMVDGAIVRRKVLEEGKEDILADGRRIRGASLPVVRLAVGVNVSKYLLDASDLWQR